jgi:hypothetical protein
MDEFIEALPAHLNQEVTLAIYKNLFDTHKMFRTFKKNNRLLHFIGSKLRPTFTASGTFIYRKGDEINDLVIVQKGIAAFVVQN